MNTEINFIRTSTVYIDVVGRRLALSICWRSSFGGKNVYLQIFAIVCKETMLEMLLPLQTLTLLWWRPSGQRRMVRTFANERIAKWSLIACVFVEPTKSVTSKLSICLWLKLFAAKSPLRSTSCRIPAHSLHLSVTKWFYNIYLIYNFWKQNMRPNLRPKGEDLQ
jgi:hypothetical protein